MARVRIQVPVEPQQQPSPETHREIPVPHLDAKKLLYVAGALIIVGLLFVLINDRNHLQSELKKESSQTQSGDQKYQAEVAKLVEVPAGVTPQVKMPSNSDLAKLVSQNSLYKDAKNGDVFLVYTNPDKSIFLVIYRPGNHKVVLAILDTSQQQSSQTQNNTKP